MIDRTNGGWPIYPGPMREPRDTSRDDCCPFCANEARRVRERSFGSVRALVQHIRAAHPEVLPKRKSGGEG